MATKRGRLGTGVGVIGLGLVGVTVLAVDWISHIGPELKGSALTVSTGLIAWGLWLCFFAKGDAGDVGSPVGRLLEADHVARLAKAEETIQRLTGELGGERLRRLGVESDLRVAEAKLDRTLKTYESLSESHLDTMGRLDEAEKAIINIRYALKDDPIPSLMDLAKGVKPEPTDTRIIEAREVLAAHSSANIERLARELRLQHKKSD